MFTGIVAGVGRVRAIERRSGGGARLTVAPPRGERPFRRGESVAVSGVCLTSVSSGRELRADLSAETLSRSTLGSLGRVRAGDNPEWLERQARRLGRRYRSYWYATSHWKRRTGFPTRPEQWPSLRGWIVRRGYTPAAATRPGFTAELRKVFRDLFPLYAFTTLEG